MNKSLYHILPHTRGWAIKKSGSKRISTFANTMRGAEKIANKLAKKYNSNIAIHNENGRLINFIKVIYE